MVVLCYWARQRSCRWCGWTYKATSHNLREPHEKSILNANDFVEHVQKYTDAIKIIHLQDVEVEEFRTVKNVDWLATPKYPGIQKTIYGLKKRAMMKYIV